MARLQHKRFDQADEVRPFDHGRTEIFELDDFVIGRMVMEPTWRWHTNVRPIAGTDRCMYHHVGYVVSGALHVQMEDGTEAEIGPREVFEIPPGHDAWVVGDEPWESIDFRGARSYAQPVAAGGERVLATLLFTDIVGSTEILERVGDARWGQMLAEHNEMIQFELDRFRGREVKRTGDGILALFDGAGRAVECASAIARRVHDEVGIDIRAGLHTGEVDLAAQDVGGVNVHLAARIMSLAGPGEVFVSSVTRDLVAGSTLQFESRGRHSLKGIEGEREVFVLI